MPIDYNYVTNFRRRTLADCRGESGRAAPSTGSQSAAANAQRWARAARQRLTSDFDGHTVAEETAQVYLVAKRGEHHPLPRLPIVEHALPER